MRAPNWEVFSKIIFFSYSVWRLINISKSFFLMRFERRGVEMSHFRDLFLWGEIIRVSALFSRQCSKIWLLNNSYLIIFQFLFAFSVLNFVFFQRFWNLDKTDNWIVFSFCFYINSLNWRINFKGFIIWSTSKQRYWPWNKIK